MFGAGDGKRLSRLEREQRRLREDLEYLAAELRRLRGKVTGGIRNEVVEEEPYDDEEE